MSTPHEPEEFYIGYEPPMPPRLARFITRVAIGASVGSIALAAFVAAGHVPLDGGTFDFGQPRPVSGIVLERPYPALRLDAVGTAATAARWALLVAPGKHGAEDLVRGFDGQRVALEGTRIQRGDDIMFEVTPGSVTSPSNLAMPQSPRAHGDAPPMPIGVVTLRGEIVDSKCFLGVMVPGAGKTHKDCASLCLRGGIPPALFVRDRTGRSSLVLLEGPSGEPVGPRAAALAGEPIEFTGPAARQGGWLRLRSDPATWLPLSGSGRRP